MTRAPATARTAAPRKNARRAFGKRRIVGKRLPSAVICLTPARPDRGRASIRATSSPNVPSRISVSGLRNSDITGVGRQRAAVVGVPEAVVRRKSTTRASGNSVSTSSRVPSVEPLSTTTTSSSDARRDARRASRGMAEPARLVRRDDDDREVVHRGTLGLRESRPTCEPALDQLARRGVYSVLGLLTRRAIPQARAMPLSSGTCGAKPSSSRLARRGREAVPDVAGAVLPGAFRLDGRAPRPSRNADRDLVHGHGSCRCRG